MTMSVQNESVTDVDTIPEGKNIEERKRYYVVMHNDDQTYRLCGKSIRRFISTEHQNSK